MARPRSSKPLSSSSSSCCHFHISQLPSQPLNPKPSSPSHSPHHLLPTLLLLFTILTLSAFLLSTANVPTLAHRRKFLETPFPRLPLHHIGHNVSDEEREFWRQPEDSGYRPCLKFSLEYRKASRRVVGEKRRFLVADVSGGLNQQRNQIVDAVVIARILRVALVVPVLKVNIVWGDESRFSDIFDVDHFKRTLRTDVRIVDSLPSSHLLLKKSSNGPQIPFNASPLLIRRILLKQLDRDGVVALTGLDSKLSRRLPPDLQKLRCKVAFHALRFAAPILELGNKLARRLWAEGPYIAVHLRLEEDVWVRTGCLPGLGPTPDRVIIKERSLHPELLTGRLSMSFEQRKLAGLCPLNAYEVARLLKALGAPRTARIYVAGGKPFGGEKAMMELWSEFPYVIDKRMLATTDELKPYSNRSSALAAIDFIVALNGDVFMASHGGNMGRTVQGCRVYAGGERRKVVRPNKRGLAMLFEKQGLSEAEFGAAVRRLHKDMMVEEKLKDDDVIAHPVGLCMCWSTSPRSSDFSY